jgi:hypothetical protein
MRNGEKLVDVIKRKGPFSFAIIRGGKIVYKDYFYIKGDFNYENLRTSQMLEMMKMLGNFEYGIIPKFLKEKSNDVIWGNYNPYHAQKVDDISKQQKISDSDPFVIEIDYNKIENNDVIVRKIGSIMFEANTLHPYSKTNLEFYPLYSDIKNVVVEYLTA